MGRPGHRAVRTLAAVLAVAALGACGSEGDVTSGTPPPPRSPESVAHVDLDRLSVDVPCWHSLAAVTPEADVGLLVDFGDWEAAQAGELPATVELPDDDWDVEVRLGEHLFFKWCDDTVERGDSEVVVRERWPAVGGTLTIHRPLPEPGCGQAGEVAATLSDLVVRGMGDERVRLGDIALVNDAWGCIPG